MLCSYACRVNDGGRSKNPVGTLGYLFLVFFLYQENPEGSCPPPTDEAAMPKRLGSTQDLRRTVAEDDRDPDKGQAVKAMITNS